MILKPRLARKARHFERGLVGEWVFNEGGGDTVYDGSGNGNAGAITGATWISSERDNALNFTSGSGDKVQIEPSGNHSGAYTISAWVKPSPSVNQTVVSTRHPTSFGFNYGFRYGGFVTIGIGDGTQWLKSEGFFSHTYISEWYRLVAVVEYPNNQYSLYLNGVLRKRESYTSGLPLLYDSIHNIYIGQGGYSGDYTVGPISNAKIYNRALSASEVQADYLDSFARYVPEPIIISSGTTPPAGTPFFYNQLLRRRYA